MRCAEQREFLIVVGHNWRRLDRRGRKIEYVAFGDRVVDASRPGSAERPADAASRGLRRFLNHIGRIMELDRLADGSRGEIRNYQSRQEDVEYQRIALSQVERHSEQRLRLV